MSEPRPRRDLSLLVDADAAAEFAAGSFDLVSTRVTLQAAVSPSRWQRLLQPFMPRQPLEAWLYSTLQQALSSESSEIGELRAPAQRTPPDVPAGAPQLVLVRSRDETWAGLQLGSDAFKFRLRTLAALALLVDAESAPDRRYQLRLTLSAEPNVPSRHICYAIPVAGQEGTSLALLETVLQLASFFRARFEYLGP